MSVAKLIRLYRPSNGTEGMYFYESWCEKCDKDDYMNGRADDFDKAERICQIIGDTLAYDVDDPEYPKEWQYRRGHPVCTAFERMRKEPRPEVFRDTLTIDMFPADNVSPIRP